MIRFPRYFIICALLLIPFRPLTANQDGRLHSHRQFKIGVIVSLTGSWSSLGQNTVAALQLAEDQLEANAKAGHGGYRFKLLVRDTQLDPAKALAAIMDLHKRGAARDSE